MSKKISAYILIAKRVREALERKQPVIALESSVIAQGLPYPVNVETAIKLEETAQKLGVTPATIAIINGRIKIGIDPDEMVMLATAPQVFKVSKRDIAPILAKNGNGGTTVAATSFIASIVGIKVFATGGIGGVHRGGQNSFDISADLIELSHNNVIIVSSGPKSIIDVTLTMEYLETIGIPVIGYKTDCCPHFFLSSMEYPVSMRTDTAEEIASIMEIRNELGICGGILVVNPLDKEYCLEPREFQNAFSIASKEAAEKNISGNKITPFLLEKINFLTEGKSQKANLMLLEKNVRLASEISRTISK